MADDTIEYRDYPILYVDDEDANLVVFEAAYGDEFNLRCATSGKDALEVLSRERIAVVMTDYRMPGMNGVDLLAIVRTQYPDIQRLLATAYSNPSTAISAINEAGVSRFIRKPFDDATLRASLQDAIRVVEHEETLRRLRLVMIERERMAGIAATRAKILHDLINMSDVVDACCSSLESLLAGQPGLPTDIEAELRTLRSAVNYVVGLHARTRDEINGRRATLVEVDEILHAVGRLAGSSTGRCTQVVVRECGLSVYGDHIDLSRILLNLVTNAARSIEDAEVNNGLVVVSARPEGDRTVLSVSDNGPGVPQQDWGRIFDMHFSTRAPDQGSGLGLSICRELARANNASLNLVPSVTGACFELSVPSRRLRVSRQHEAGR